MEGETDESMLSVLAAGVAAVVETGRSVVLDVADLRLDATVHDRAAALARLVPSAPGVQLLLVDR